MTDSAFARELLEEIDALSPEDRRRVREFAHALRVAPAVGPCDAAERRRLVEDALASMKRSPWPEDAPRFTREELHARG